MGRFTLLLGLFSLTVFLVSLGMHVAGYVPGAPRSFDEVKWLAFAAFACFLLMAGNLPVLNRQVRERVRSDDAVKPWIEELIPRWVWNVGGPAFVYTASTPPCISPCPGVSPDQGRSVHAGESRARRPRGERA